MADIPAQSALENINARSIRVGNITQTVNYHQPAQALSTAVKNWLPPLPGAWQTRQEEQTILEYLTDDSVRLVGIFGAGGFGKSALAAQVYRQAQGFSHQLWANFEEPTNFGTFGRWLISELLGKEVYARVRDLYERDTEAELIAKTLNELSQRRCLLVLDNLETLFQTEELWQPYGEFLAAWLGIASAGKLILTSQLRLDLPGSGWQWLPLQGLTLAQGVALLRAQQIEGRDEQLAEFVERADGHPLLLRLAASWLQQQAANELEPAAIYRLGHDDLSLLEGILGQHRGDTAASVGKLLDLGFDKLHPEWLQVLLWRLSVLRGRFGLGMAQAMVSETVELAQVRQLARWSFVQERRVDGEWLFEFLPLIGRYLQLRAQTAGEELSGHQRAIQYFSEHIQPWDGTINSCAEELEIFYHQCELGKYQLAKEVMDSCVEKLDRSGYYQALVKVYTRLTSEWQPANDDECRNLGWAWTRLGNLDRQIGQVRAAITAHQSAQQLFEQIDFAQGKAAALGGLGNAYDSLGEYPRAIEFHQQWLDIAREIGDRRGEASSLGGLGNAYDSLGEYPRAIEFHQQWLDIAREIGDRLGEASSLGGLGNAYQSLGEYPRAIEFHQQRLDIAREIGDRRGEASSLGGLGNAYQSLGEYPRAIEFHQQWLDIAREIGDRLGEASSLGGLGNAYQSLGEYPRAIEFHQQSLVIEREIGNRLGEASSLGGLGNAYQSLGEYPRAIEFHQQWLDIAREIGNRLGEASSLGGLGNAYQSLGEYPRAIEFHQQWLDIAREIGNRLGEASSLGGLGNAYQSLGEYPRAIEFHQQWLDIAREIGNRLGEASSLGGLGNAYQSLGEYPRAIEFHQQSLVIEREIGNRRGEAISLYNQALALAKYETRRFEAIDTLQQARIIYLDLELSYMVEKCDNQIRDFNQIIATESQLRAPAIELARPAKPDWWEKSLPASEKPKVTTERQKWWLWFAVGLAIVLIIWWLKK